jgi:hypothetical protein
MLHRFLGREDDASRSAGLLASAAPTPSRLRSGLSVGVFQAVTAARLPRIHTGFPCAERALTCFELQPDMPDHLRNSTAQGPRTQVARLEGQLW